VEGHPFAALGKRRGGKRRIRLKTGLNRGSRGGGGSGLSSKGKKGSRGRPKAGGGCPPNRKKRKNIHGSKKQRGHDRREHRRGGGGSKWGQSVWFCFPFGGGKERMGEGGFLLQSGPGGRRARGREGRNRKNPPWIRQTFKAKSPADTK